MKNANILCIDVLHMLRESRDWPERTHTRAAHHPQKNTATCRQVELRPILTESTHNKRNCMHGQGAHRILPPCPWVPKIKLAHPSKNFSSLDRRTTQLRYRRVFNEANGPSCARRAATITLRSNVCRGGPREAIYIGDNGVIAKTARHLDAARAGLEVCVVLYHMSPYMHPSKLTSLHPATPL